MQLSENELNRVCPGLLAAESKIHDLITEYAVPVNPEVSDLLADELKQSSLEPAKIAKAIALDPGIASGILQIANAYKGEVSEDGDHLFVSVHDAVDFVGVEQIPTMFQVVMALQSKIKDSSVRFDRFWDSATDVAILAHHIAHRLAFNRLEETEAYTLGLLRDCGIPIMMQAFPDYMNVLRDASDNPDYSLAKHEDKHYPFNHQMVGYCLGASWHLPRMLSWSILSHHLFEPPIEDISSKLEKKNILISLVYIAELISTRFRRLLHRRASGEEVPNDWPPIHPYILGHLDITSDDLEDLMEDILNKCENLINVS